MASVSALLVRTTCCLSNAGMGDAKSRSSELIKASRGRACRPWLGGTAGAAGVTYPVFGSDTVLRPDRPKAVAGNAIASPALLRVTSKGTFDGEWGHDR